MKLSNKKKPITNRHLTSLCNELSYVKLSKKYCNALVEAIVMLLWIRDSQ